MTKAIARDPIYRRRRFQSELIELCVRWVSHISAHIALDDFALGPAVRARVREAMGSLCPAGGFVLEDERDRGFGAGRRRTSVLPFRSHTI
jgi:hypothetical protein